MICIFHHFDLGMFSNGILISILAAALFVLINRVYSICSFYRRYSYLKSPKKDEYDWEAFSFTKEDGRKLKDESNGSLANVRVNACKMMIYITLKEDNGRKWEGELNMKGYGFGTLIYKYSDKHEYGHKDCYIGKNDDGNYIYITPVNRKIISLKEGEKLSIEYDYGNEILLR